ncbi:MAG: hypothetical protein ACREQ5_05245 [Candidatus Dormibacteria bacterium]
MGPDRRASLDKALAEIIWPLYAPCTMSHPNFSCREWDAFLITHIRLGEDGWARTSFEEHRTKRGKLK